MKQIHFRWPGADDESGNIFFVPERPGMLRATDITRGWSPCRSPRNAATARGVIGGVVRNWEFAAMLSIDSTNASNSD